jgi:putative phosphoribosyl transferase
VARIYADRHDAGRALVPELQRLALANPLVLGLARGGVPVAFEVARALGAPLDVIVVRKLGAPAQPELAVGAIASGGVRVLNERIIESLNLGESALSEVESHEREELERRERRYRGDRPYPELAGRDVVIVDDGIATGATMLAAVQAVRTREPATTIVAVPTASARSLRKLEAAADEVVCLDSPPDFYAVGQFYVDFSQTTDAEVAALLNDEELQVQSP